MKFIKAFSGFSYKDKQETIDFYTKLGVEVEDNGMGLELKFPDGMKIFAYPKESHEPATFTILNFVVEDIDEAVDELVAMGVKMERYEGFPFKQDEKGIARSEAPEDGPTIAWFKDPSGNVLSVLQN